MKISQYSYRFAGAVLTDPALSSAFAELTVVLQNATAPLYPVGKVKTRQRGKAPARFFPVNQKALNKQIEAAMPAGWHIRPLVVDPTAKGPATKIRSDFVKDRIQVEVQFGNMARWYTDVFKFQLAYSLDTIDVGILVVPLSKFANLIDENVASFERVIRELPWAKMSLTLPILVLGIEPDNYAPIKACYDAAAAAWSADPKHTGKATRPFEDALAADPDLDSESDDSEEESPDETAP